MQQLKIYLLTLFFLLLMANIPASAQLPPASLHDYAKKLKTEGLIDQLLFEKLDMSIQNHINTKNLNPIV